MRAKGIDWQPEHDDMLKPMWRDGISAEACAAKLNKRFGLTLSRSAVIGRCHRKKFPGVGRKVASPRRNAPAPRKFKTSSRSTPFRGNVRSPSTALDYRIKTRVERSQALQVPHLPFRFAVDKENDFGCRWIEGDDGVVCGSEVKHGSYCDAHASRVYR